MPSTDSSAPILAPIGCNITAARQGQPLANPLSICWRRKGTIALAFLLVFASSVLFWQAQDKVFHSSTQLLLIAGETTGQLRSSVAKQATVDAQIEQFKSPSVKKRVLQQALSPWKAANEESNDASERLEIKSKLNLLTLNFTAATPELCRQQLASIVESYRDYLKDTPQSNHKEACLQLTGKLRQLETQLKYNRKQHLLLLKPTPFVGTSRSLRDQLDERLQRLESKRQDLKIRHAQLQRQLQSLTPFSMTQTAAPNASKLPALPQLEQYAAQEVLASELKQRATASYGRENHSEVRRATLEAQQAREVYAEVSKHSTLTSELAELEQSTLAVEALLRAEQRLSQKWSRVAIKADQLNTEMESQKEQISDLKREIQHRATAAELETFQLHNIAPIEAGVPSSLRDLLCFYFLPGSVGGLVLGLSLAYCAEFFDQSFRTPNELKRRLGLPILGELPFALAQDLAQETATKIDCSPTDSLVANYQLSQSTFAGQFRRIRTALMLKQSTSNGQVLLITSPRSGDGRTLATANLASAFAQAGSKTLIIDTNFQRPKQHQLFGTLNKIGLTQVLTKQNAWQTTVQATGRANLDLIASGQTKDTSVDLLSSPDWHDFLQSARKTYDTVLVDAPALLTNLDSLIVAQSADRIVLLLRAGRRSGSEAEQAFELLGPLTQRIAGVVMSNIKNRRHIWRTDPFESLNVTHNPLIASPTTATWPNTYHTPPSPTSPRREYSVSSRNKPLVDYDASELENLLTELNAEIKQVVAHSNSAAPLQRPNPANK